MIKPSDPCKITDTLYSIGPARVPVFLLDGDCPVLFEGGIFVFKDMYISEMRKLLGDRNPEFLFLTHMHFDHCGAAGFLKENIPGFQICASQEGADIIQKESAQKLIERLNTLFLEKPEPYHDFTVDRVLEDGEIINVSKDATIEVIKTPGHTRDMTSYYIPELKALVPSESTGVLLSNGYIYSEFLIGYEEYMKSLDRLKQFEVDYLMMAHGFYLTGDDARKHIDNAIESSKLFRDRLEVLIKKYGNDFDLIAAEVRKEEFDNFDPNEIQPEEAYLLNLRAKVNAVAAMLNP